MNYGQDFYRIRAQWGRGAVGDPRGYAREYGPGGRDGAGARLRPACAHLPDEEDHFHGGAAWGGFRHIDQEELRAGVPQRIERTAREGYAGYGGYPGPRRSEQWGRYDRGYRPRYDRGW